MAMNETTKAIHQIGKILEKLGHPTRRAVIDFFSKQLDADDAPTGRETA